MVFGRTPKEASPQQYFVPYWDERLYQVLVGSSRSPRAHHFACVLSARSSTLEPADGGVLVHEYHGVFKLWLSEAEFCEIGVIVSFDAGHDYFDKEVNKYALGFWRFSWERHDGRTRPALTVTLRDKTGLSEAVARLFFEVRTLSKTGPSFSWSSDLQNIAGLSAAQVWGDWENRSWTGDPDSPPPGIGLDAFALETATFKALA